MWLPPLLCVSGHRDSRIGRTSGCSSRARHLGFPKREATLAGPAAEPGRSAAEVDRVAKVDYSLPDGEYYCLTAFVAKGSDFTLDEAGARLRAALPGRVVRGFPTRRDRRVLAP